jgi:hypothetical protein
MNVAIKDGGEAAPSPVMSVSAGEQETLTEIPMSKPEETPEVIIARERTEQVSTAGWTGGLSVFFAAGALTANPTWPVAVGVAALAAMIAVICHGILRR